jgi:hypothetical protein
MESYCAFIYNESTAKRKVRLQMAWRKTKQNFHPGDTPVGTFGAPSSEYIYPT